MGVNSLPKTVTRQRRACDFWTQALLRRSPVEVRFLLYNTGLVQYRWTGLDLLTADRLKMQDWKIVNSSKYFLSCCTYVFHRCRFVLAFSVLAFSTLAYSYLRIPYLHIPSSGTFVFRTCVFSRPEHELIHWAALKQGNAAVKKGISLTTNMTKRTLTTTIRGNDTRVIRVL